MPVTADQPAPYAPASAIIDLISRHRNKGLPSPVDADVLARAGISASLIPRTLQAMHTLDLLNDDGTPSQMLESIRLASEADYLSRLWDWLKEAYADALVFVDPAAATESQIRDAFRNYRPIGQQARMVSLFIGLCAAAGVGAEKAKQPAAKKPSSVAKKPSAASTATSVKHAGNLQPQTGVPPAILGLLASLPSAGQGWSQFKRDGFVATFATIVDFLFPIVEDAPTNGNGGQD